MLREFEDFIVCSCSKKLNTNTGGTMPSGVFLAMVTVTFTEPAPIYRERIVEGDCHLAAQGEGVRR